ncbi:MAG TPA: glycosyltransferase family 2 protein [Candidatus Dormibacteraeota bacterium]|nr:glycosyltransferase family 2 protein [Candidatus Dormibacteraeota bacterium]
MLPPNRSDRGSFDFMEQHQKRTIRCSVIVLNFNGRGFLADCLDSLNRQTFSNFETVVLDNGSSDGSAALVRERYPRVQVLALDKNYGFSIAYNVALRRTIAQGTEYALLLNNDTFVDPNFVEEMVETIESDCMAGAVCPKIYFADQPNAFWYAGGDFSLWTARARHRGWRKTDSGQFDDQREITLATGCAMLVRCSALREVGLLDEQLWLYLEDVEWSVRFLKKGYRLAFASKARVWHCDGGTAVRLLGAGSQAMRQYLSTRNMILLARKHARWWQLPSYCGGFLVNHIAFYTALRLWRRDFKALLAIYRGLWEGLRMPLMVRGPKSGTDGGQVLPVGH